MLVGKRGTLAVWFGVMLALLVVSCVPNIQIVRTASQDAKPTWINRPPQHESLLYFVGIGSNADTLEQGQELAIKDALAKIASFMRTNVQSLFEENTTEIEQRLKQQIKATSTARVQNAHLEDSYHEKVMRAEGRLVIERYDVYALVSYQRSQVAGELQRQEKERDEKVITAHALYVKARQSERGKSYRQAKEYYKQAQTLLASLEEMVELNRDGIRNSKELANLVETGLREALTRMRSLSLSVKIAGPDAGDREFYSNFSSAMEKRGFNLTPQDSAIEIRGNISTSQGGVVMNNHVFYAKGSLTAVRRGDRYTIVTIPVNSKGFHRDMQHAALSALAEAGTEAGDELAKILLQREFKE